jgi:DNA repair ATPase RecN
MSEPPKDFLTVDEIKERIRNRVRQLDEGSHTSVEPSQRLDELRRNLRSANLLLPDVGAISARPHGRKNSAIQLLKRTIRRLLTWFLRPLRQFNAAILATLSETAYALEALQADITSIMQRLRALEANTNQHEIRGQQLTNPGRQHDSPEVDRLQRKILSEMDSLRGRIDALASDVQKLLENCHLEH